MKNSRLFAIITFMMVALFAAGAILGSIVPQTIIYVAVTAGAIAMALYGLWFYYGHKKEEEEDEPEDDSEGESEE